MKENTPSLFSGKILGVCNYAKKEFHAEDFTDLGKLTAFLWEVDTGESDITPAGKSFLDKYYGFKQLSEILSDGNKFRVSSESSTSEEIETWLKQLEPMQTITFIEQARGNVSKDEPEEMKRLNKNLYKKVGIILGEADVSGLGGPLDEYDSLIPHVWKLLELNNKDQITKALKKLFFEYFGSSDQEQVEIVARRLLSEIKVERDAYLHSLLFKPELLPPESI